MIVRETPRPWQLLFIMRGSIVPTILPQLVFVLALSALVTWLHHTGRFTFQAISPLPFSMIGIALSIFAGFRNSASFERWWEGRRLLGQLVIDCRSLSRAALTHLNAERGRKLAKLAIAFAKACKNHLRDELPASQLGEDLSADLGSGRNPPDRILMLASREIASALQAGEIAAPLGQMMEERIVSLSGVLAGTERIKLTPLPFAYSLLLHRTAYLFCVLLPFGLADSTGLWTPVLCGIVAYTFFGLDALGDELAAPFGTGQNALPLAAIVRTIEINVLEQLGSEKLPEPLAPRGFVLD